MSSSAYYRHQARICLSLARSVRDVELAHGYEDMALNFLARADQALAVVSDAERGPVVENAR
jgi:hypothetical protein